MHYLIFSSEAFSSKTTYCNNLSYSSMITIALHSYFLFNSIKRSLKHSKTYKIVLFSDNKDFIYYILGIFDDSWKALFETALNIVLINETISLAPTKSNFITGAY
jgi:hypothetical protein